jgi:TIR domain
MPPRRSSTRKPATASRKRPGRSRRRPPGMVFISYAHADRERVEPLVNALVARFNVWWDRDIEIGQTWRQSLVEKLAAARCVVVVWTVASVNRDFIWSEVERAKDRGILLPVKLDRQATIPLGFDQLQHLDLTDWTPSMRSMGRLRELFSRIDALLTRSPRERYAPTLKSDAWALDNSIAAAGELRQLTEQLRTIGGVLMPDGAPSEDLRGTLDEVHRTYSAVSRAIGRFVAPVVRSGRVSARPYLAMERGELIRLIENNRGHCSRILEYYGRVGGLRDWLVRRLKEEHLEQLDQTFGRLSTADGDLFANLVQVGRALTGEASAIVGLILSGQQRLARERILEGREKLLPLERSLSDAMGRLQTVESSLGFVPRPGLLRP